MKPVLRPATEDDVPFIVNSFLKSYKNTDQGRMITNRIYYNAMHEVAENLVKESTVTVACEPDDANHILGYAISFEGLVHYIYVKHVFRRFGIGRVLYESITKPVYFTFYTEVGARLAKRVNLTFCPYHYLERSDG